MPRPHEIALHPLLRNLRLLTVSRCLSDVGSIIFLAMAVGIIVMVAVSLKMSPIIPVPVVVEPALTAKHERR
jgi:hypothetical protein